MKKYLVSIAMAALAAPLFAQTTVPARVACIDVQKVLTTSTAGKAAYDKLKKLQDDRVAKMQKMDEEVKALANELQTKKLSLSEEKQAEMAKTITDKQTALQRYAQDADKEVSEARDKALQELDGKIKPIIDSIGKEMGLAAIFNKFESGLIYASDAIDITDTVIKRFNEANPAAAAKP
jgi:outer membrane protein